MTDLQTIAREAAERFYHGVTGVDSAKKSLVYIILHALETVAGESKKQDWAYYLATPTELVCNLQATITDLRAQLANREIDLRSETDFASNLSKELDAAKAQLEQARKDGERLSWLIKQGPPGAAEYIGLNEDAWEAAVMEVSDEPRGDQDAMRTAIDTARQAGVKDGK